MRTIPIWIDGDWLLYTAGFASQQTQYVYRDKSRVAGPYKGLTDLRQAVGDGYDPQYVYSRIEVDPVEHALHSVKQMIRTQVERVKQKWPGFNVNVGIYVDGDGNFRNRLATIRPYKGNRAINSKPLLYNEIYGYLLDHWAAEVVCDIETDDRLTQLHREYGGVIVGVDKDYLQSPGWHLNPNKGFKFVDEQEGLERLYHQAAMGDTADNIGGCYKVGQKGADALFKGCGFDEGTMWDILCFQYAESIEKFGDVYNGLSAGEAALENMRLVYLLREEGEDLWLPPGAR